MEFRVFWHRDNMRIFPVVRKDTRLNWQIKDRSKWWWNEIGSSLNIQAEIPLGPVEVLDGIWRRSFATSMLEHKRWEGHSSEEPESPEAVERGGTDRLKQLQKNWLIILALGKGGS